MVRRAGACAVSRVDLCSCRKDSFPGVRKGSEEGSEIGLGLGNSYFNLKFEESGSGGAAEKNEGSVGVGKTAADNIDWMYEDRFYTNEPLPDHFDKYLPNIKEESENYGLDSAWQSNRSIAVIEPKNYFLEGVDKEEQSNKEENRILTLDRDTPDLLHIPNYATVMPKASTGESLPIHWRGNQFQESLPRTPVPNSPQPEAAHQSEAPAPAASNPGSFSKKPRSKAKAVTANLGSLLSPRSATSKALISTRMPKERIGSRLASGENLYQAKIASPKASKGRSPSKPTSPVSAKLDYQESVSAGKAVSFHAAVTSLQKPDDSQRKAGKRSALSPKQSWIGLEEANRGTIDRSELGPEPNEVVYSLNSSQKIYRKESSEKYKSITVGEIPKFQKGKKLFSLKMSRSPKAFRKSKNSGSILKEHFALSEEKKSGILLNNSLYSATCGPHDDSAHLIYQDPAQQSRVKTKDTIKQQIAKLDSKRNALIAELR